MGDPGGNRKCHESGGFRSCLVSWASDSRLSIHRRLRPAGRFGPNSQWATSSPAIQKANFRPSVSTKLTDSAYAPDVERREEPFASPLRASDEQLAGLPPAFVIVDEADVLRDEGEAYAARLRQAGVAVTTVRYDGITHDFMMLNPLSDTHATRAAVAQAISVLHDALHAA